MDEIDIKDEPLQDDLVSVFYKNVFSQFFLHDIHTKFFICSISHAVLG